MGKIMLVTAALVVAGMSAMAGDDSTRDILEDEFGRVECVKKEELTGIYMVDALPVYRGKKFQGSWLVLDDGRRALLSYRPVAEYFKFINKKVVIEGCPYQPYGQSIFAWHFKALSIGLTHGEKFDKIGRGLDPTKIPTPPVVRSEGELVKNNGSWMALHGKITSSPTSANDCFWTAELILRDGVTIKGKNMYSPKCRKITGGEVTVVTRLFPEEAGSVKEYRVGGAICQGYEPRCGMDERN